MGEFFKRIIYYIKRVIGEIVSFSFEHIFEFLHRQFPNVKWLHVSYYFFKDHCPMRAASLSFYTLTYMVSGLFLVIFISQLFNLNFAEGVVTHLISLALPEEIIPTTDYIITFTKEILANQSILIFASIIAVYNIMILLAEIKENFDEILDHYYTKSGGTYLRNQLVKIVSVFGFIVIFHFFVQPITREISQFALGETAVKYAFNFLLLFLLFHHSSNKLNTLLVLKGALITTIFLFALEYFIFGFLSDKHAFFGSESHQGGLGMIFLFPFWVYLAWNFVFIGLEYIATHTKQSIHKFPIEMESYMFLSILELLYTKKSLEVKFITKRFNISYRHAQELIIHTLLKRQAVTYDRRNDQLISLESWADEPLFKYFKLKHMLIKVEDSQKLQLIQKMSEEKQRKITFRDYFELKHAELDTEEQEPTLWDRFKNLFS